MKSVYVLHSVRTSDVVLSLEITRLGLNIIADTGQISPLAVGVEVNLDYAVGYGILEV
jgi:hypothetical protein